MLRITIICVGSLKENYFSLAVNEYKKRLMSLCKFNIIEISEEKLPLNPNLNQIKAALQGEGEKIIKKIPSNSKVAALCVEGALQSSEQLAEFLQQTANYLSSVCFIIGSSYGLSDQVKNISDIKLSMSKMTFPHQLARVMLSEQIYRAFKINQNSKYHK